MVDPTPLEAPVTTTSHVADAVDSADLAGDREAAPAAGRIRTVAAALALAALTSAALLVTTPWGERLDSSADDVMDYDDLLAVRDAVWTGLLVDGFAFAVIGVTIGLATCHLARTRGRVAALVGGLLSTAGGILFAMGGLAFATFVWFATSDGLPESAGRSLVAYGNDHVGHLMGAVLAGFLLYTVGTLFLATALLRARAVPLPAVAAYVLLVLAQFAPVSGRAVDVVQIAMMALLVAYAGLVWRRAEG